MNTVITGATKGIGRAIALSFAEKGYNLCLCARTQGDLEALQSDIFRAHPHLKVHIMAVDVSVKSEVIAFADFIKATWSQVDILVNNAGVWLGDHILSEDNDGLLEQLIQTNLYSAYHLSRHVLPAMLPHKKGYIINICSVASTQTYLGSASYSISKFALLGFSKALREELKPHNIKVSSVMPGATWTNAWKGVDFPAARLMQAEDVAKAVAAIVELGDSAVVEEILIRPQLGDI
ncbi:MAG: SDR family oxidoreductase [Chitinophagales bacterium]